MSRSFSLSLPERDRERESLLRSPCEHLELFPPYRLPNSRCHCLSLPSFHSPSIPPSFFWRRPLDSSLFTFTNCSLVRKLSLAWGPPGPGTRVDNEIAEEKEGERQGKGAAQHSAPSFYLSNLLARLCFLFFYFFGFKRRLEAKAKCCNKSKCRFSCVCLCFSLPSHLSFVLRVLRSLVSQFSYFVF